MIFNAHKGGSLIEGRDLIEDNVIIIDREIDYGVKHEDLMHDARVIFELLRSSLPWRSYQELGRLIRQDIEPPRKSQFRSERDVKLGLK